MTQQISTTFILAFAVLVIAAGVAGASDDGSSEPGQSGPAAIGPAEDGIEGVFLRSLRVTGSALRPREDNVNYATSSSGGCIYANAGDAFTVFNVAVTDLRQGATVDALRMYYDDTSGSNSSAWFTVYDLYGGLVDEWSVTTDGSTGNGFTDSAQINHVVDYNQFSYLLNWRPTVTGSSMQLCGFRIFYSD